MSLNNDLLKHTIFLQRLATKEHKLILKQIEELVGVGLENINKSLKTRNKAVSDTAQEMTHDLDEVYDYERRFIRRLLKKYETHNTK